MSVYFLLMACLVGSALATITTVPSDMVICGLQNPEYDKCVLTAIENMGPRLESGISEWDVPSIDPFELESITLAHSADLMATCQRVKFFGLSKYAISGLHFNLKKLLLTFHVDYDVIKLVAHYNLRAKLGSVVIAGEGPCTVVATGIKADVEIQFNMTKHQGESHIYLSSLTTKLGIADYEAKIAPSNKTDSAITESMNSLLQNEKDLFKAEMTPSIEKTVSEVGLKFGNQFCRNVPARIILPDRE